MTQPSNLALTICQSGAGDRNTRAMLGARLLGEALAVRVGATPTIIGQVTAPVGGTWREELAAARPRLRGLVDSLERAFSARRTPITTLSPRLRRNSCSTDSSIVKNAEKCIMPAMSVSRNSTRRVVRKGIAINDECGTKN